MSDRQEYSIVNHRLRGEPRRQPGDVPRRDGPRSQPRSCGADVSCVVVLAGMGEDGGGVEGLAEVVVMEAQGHDGARLDDDGHGTTGRNISPGLSRPCGTLGVISRPGRYRSPGGRLPTAPTCRG